MHSLSARYFGGGGDQVAQINSPYLAYFQAVPSRMHNVSVVGTSVFTSHLVNQLVVGFNYFLQKFNSFDTSADPIALGLNTGVTDPTLAGPPNITISGFAAVGGTQPLGRTDKTLHFTDSMSYTPGAHQFKVGGEVRLAKLFIFYDSNKRGTFTFDGTAGPWASLPAAQASPRSKALADFMSGRVATGSIVLGNTHHDYFQNSFDVYAQDVWSVSPKLTVNAGLRYTYPGVLGATRRSAHDVHPEPGHGLDRQRCIRPTRRDLSPRIGIRVHAERQPQDRDPRRLGAVLRHARGELLHREHRLRQRRRARRRQQSRRHGAGLFDHADEVQHRQGRAGVRHHAAAAVRRVRGEPGSEAAVRDQLQRQRRSSSWRRR